jgi:hypothetical protein
MNFELRDDRHQPYNAAWLIARDEHGGIDILISAPNEYVWEWGFSGPNPEYIPEMGRDWYPNWEWA